MWKIVIFVAVILYVVYLLMALGQAFSVLRFTNRKITPVRMLIPFYYWIAPMDEKSTTKIKK